MSFLHNNHVFKIHNISLLAQSISTCSDGKWHIYMNWTYLSVKHEKWDAQMFVCLGHREVLEVHLHSHSFIIVVISLLSHYIQIVVRNTISESYSKKMLHYFKTFIYKR